MKLSCHDWLDQVWFVAKTRQNNNMINRIALVYAKIETELSGPIRSTAVSDEN